MERFGHGDYLRRLSYAAYSMPKVFNPAIKSDIAMIVDVPDTDTFEIIYELDGCQDIKYMRQTVRLNKVNMPELSSKYPIMMSEFEARQDKLAAAIIEMLKRKLHNDAVYVFPANDAESLARKDKYGRVLVSITFHDHTVSDNKFTSLADWLIERGYAKPYGAVDNDWNTLTDAGVDHLINKMKSNI
jgi:endonuclease YncB( thermonuclease family)